MLRTGQRTPCTGRNHRIGKKVKNLKELHQEFIKHRLHAQGNTRVTIKNYRDSFGLLLQFKPDMKLEDLIEETMVNFMEFLNTRERKVGNKMIVRAYKNSSLATVRGKLGVFFNWLKDRKHIEENPFKKIPHPTVTYTDKRMFTSQEFEIICNAINSKIQWINLLLKKRNIAIVMFLALTGVRKNEMLCLKLTDMDMKNKLVTVREETSKSRTSRTIQLSPELIQYLEDYFKYREDYTTDALWVSSTGDRPFSEEGMKHFIDQLSAITGINCHLHRFRHTFAVNYYLKTRDLIGLKQILGHRSFKMTMVYLRSLTNDPTVQVIQEMVSSEFM